MGASNRLAHAAALSVAAATKDQPCASPIGSSSPGTGSSGTAAWRTITATITAISDSDGAADFVLENSAPGSVVGVTAFADDAERLGIEALHSFTFNAVADTRAWQETIMSGGASA